MKKIIIIDIDGTLSKVEDRLKYLEEIPSNWSSFYEACDEDEPIENICDLTTKLDENYNIVFCTGRIESVRQKTIFWLKKHIGIIEKDLMLLMRPNGDFRHDTIIKPELLKKANINLDSIAFVLEDRNSMVKKWRELGLNCLQVAEGDF